MNKEIFAYFLMKYFNEHESNLSDSEYDIGFLYGFLRVIALFWESGNYSNHFTIDAISDFQNKVNELLGAQYRYSSKGYLHAAGMIRGINAACAEIDAVLRLNNGNK